MTTEPKKTQRQTLLERGSCCGEDCRSCPYLPRHVRGAVVVDPKHRQEAVEVRTKSARLGTQLRKQAEESRTRDALIGAATGAALPAVTHARYEAIDLPGHRRRINRLIEKAREQKKFYRSPTYDDFRNPLQKKMRLGDTILQSHSGYSLRDMLKSRQPDFTTLSLGGSGSPFAHAAVATNSGRAIDPGKEGVKAFKDGLLAIARDTRGVTREKINELRELRKINPRSVADAKYLMRHGVDAFESGIDRPNVSVVMRPQNLSGVSQEKLQRAIADVKSVGYAKTDATLSGLRTLVDPFPKSRRLRGMPDLAQGTFCSHGACTSQALHGLKTPAYNAVLPHHLLQTRNQDLVGIGVNKTLMDAHKPALRGLQGQARMAEGARLTMLDTLRHAANTRRVFAGGLMGVLGLAGAGAGLVANSARTSKPDTIGTGVVS